MTAATATRKRSATKRRAQRRTRQAMIGELSPGAIVGFSDGAFGVIIFEPGWHWMNGVAVDFWDEPPALVEPTTLVEVLS